MPITVNEAVDSRVWDGESVTMRWLIAGTDNDAFALAALVGVMPVKYQDPVTLLWLYPVDRPAMESVWVDETSGRGQWKASVTYKPPTRLGLYPVGSLQLMVDTTGGTMHRTASIQTVGAYTGVAGPIPDFKGAVGVTKDSIEGVDVPMPVFNLKAEKVWDVTALPNWDTMYRLSGTVNSAQVTITDTATGVSFTFALGELLFRGGSMGTLREDGGLPVTYAFEASPNATGLAIGTRITGIAKKGWEHLWVYYEEEEDAGPPARLVRRPFYAYVEKVIPSGDFSGLGIFT